MSPNDQDQRPPAENPKISAPALTGGSLHRMVRRSEFFAYLGAILAKWETCGEDTPAEMADFLEDIYREWEEKISENAC